MKHPKGLYILFFTEMWERFSYYGMRAILVLYLVSETGKSGLGWAEADALSLYGWYTMMVYVMSIPGGIIADKFLGQRKSVMVGGFLLCAGHFLMAYTALWAFYAALVLIVLGVGMLKPNISTMVGALYDRDDPRKDAGFTIFYMGINIGAFASALIVGYVGEKVGWHYGFALAGIGMLLGQAVYIYGQKYLGDAGILKKALSTGSKQVIEPLTKIEIDRLVVLMISFLIVIVFWAAFEQAGGLMNLYTDKYIYKDVLGWEVPTSWFQSLNPFFIITLAPLFAFIWVKLARSNKEPSAIFKMGLGTVILGTGFLLMVGASLQRASTGDKSSLWWVVGAYLLHTLGELCLSPVALSFITKMAPERIASIMMGIYFAATGLASKGAAYLGALAQSLGELAIFSGIAITTMVLGALLMLLSKMLNKLSHYSEFENEAKSSS